MSKISLLSFKSFPDVHFLLGIRAEFGRMLMTQSCDLTTQPRRGGCRRQTQRYHTEDLYQADWPGEPQGRHGARTMGLILIICISQHLNLDSKAAEGKGSLQEMANTSRTSFISSSAIPKPAQWSCFWLYPASLLIPPSQNTVPENLLGGSFTFSLACDNYKGSCFDIFQGFSCLFHRGL